MISDRNISLTLSSALLLWAIALALIVVEWLGMPTGDLGLLVAAGAAVLSVRRMLCRQADRERNAFEIGRDVGHEEARRLRSIP